MRAVASVANLAVSAVGFYIVNKKLNALQSQMNNIHEDIQNLSYDIHIGFSELSERLIQIQYLMGTQLTRVEQDLDEIKDQNDASILGPIHVVIDGIVELEERQELPSATRIDAWIDNLRNSQKQLEYLISKWCTGNKPVNSAGFARGTGYYKLWGLAVITEARLMRILGRTKQASDLLYQKLSRDYYPNLQKTVNLLLDFDKGILLSAPFEGMIQTDHYFKLIELVEGELANEQNTQRWIDAASDEIREVFGNSPRERLNNVYSMKVGKHLSQAAEAYSLIELGKRINTMAVEYEICAKNNLSFDQWERAQLEDEGSNDIHLLPIA